MDKPTTSTTSESTDESDESVNYLNLDADKVLSAFGKYGKYQMLTYCITMSVQVLFAVNMMVMPFITKPASFECSFDAKPQWTFTRIPDDQCHILDSNNWSIPCLIVPGAQYNYTDAGDSLASDFNLVCDDQDAMDHGTSVFLLGNMLVAPLASQLSDIFGRRKTFLIPLYISVISNIFSAFAWNFTAFLIGRFFSGVATASFTMIGYVLCMESVSMKFRSLIPILGTITWVGGYTLAGFLSLFIHNWRVLYLVITIPSLLTIPFYFFTPESLHWLITKRKGKKVEKFINNCQEFNKKDISLKECESDAYLMNRVAAERNATDLFKNSSIFFNLMINSYILIVMNGTYWALSLFSTELSDDGITGYFLSGLVELPAGLLSVPLLIWLPRKTVSFLALASTSVFLLCSVYIPMTGNWGMIFPLLAKSMNSIAWSSQPLLYSEGTPTSIRNVYCGIVSFIGDIGSVVAPYSKRLEVIDKNAPFLLITILSIIASILVYGLPETKNRKLPEDIEDFEPGPILRRFRRFRVLSESRPQNLEMVDSENTNCIA